MASRPQKDRRTEVQLTAEENAMLTGEEGPAKHKALEFIVEYATAVGADRLVKIRKAQIFIGAHHYLRVVESEDIDEVISEMYLNTSDRVVLERVACFTQSDAMPHDPDSWQDLGVKHAQAEADKRYRDRFRKAGVADGGSCAAYLIGFIPLFGEHYVSTESHALLLMNSMWGARANADSIEASICSAVCGRTPYFGMHVTERRAGTHVVRVESDPTSVFDWDLLGFTLGERLPPNAVPVLVGEFEPPDIERFKSFCAALSTSGSAELCHIVGLTPEAPTVDGALHGVSPEGRMTITSTDLQEMYRRIFRQGRAKVKFVSLGCPHYSLAQIQYVAESLNLRRQRIHPDVVLQVWTAAPIKESARRSGFVAAIEDAGGGVFTSSCPLVMESVPDVPAMAFDSLKQARYVATTTGAKVFAGSVDQCLDAAVTGVWRGLPDA